MSFVLFDSASREALFPIAFVRPIGSIRVGILTIKEKWEHYLKCKTTFLVPAYLSEKFPSFQEEEKNYFINAALFPTQKLIVEILKLEKGQKLIHKNNLLAFVAGPSSWSDINKLVADFEELQFENEIKLLANTWNIISFLKDELMADTSLVVTKYQSGKFPIYSTIISPENIFLGKRVKIGACILNATEGIIVIDDDAVIDDGAIIKGPIYLGKGSIINMGAKIHGPVSIGDNCKVGGEVSHSVFQAFCNKGHDGFLGHSYIGEWCNLGADTNISNLKNTYDKVRIWNYASERFDKTGLQFLGLVMGDHSKTGINSMLNTGTVIGVACNVFGAGFPRNFMPDFTIGGSQKMEEFNMKPVIKMAQAMMQRRELNFSKQDEKIFEYVFKYSKKYRKY